MLSACPMGGGGALPFEHNGGQVLSICGDGIGGGSAWAPAAPTVQAEPTFTAGQRNTISWSAVEGATGYRAQVAADAAFESVIADSGWIEGLSHTFIGLAEGVTYHYRVKSRYADAAVLDRYEQTTAADFAANGQSGVTVVEDGSVQLAVSTGPAPTVTDVVASDATEYSGRRRARLNAYEATSDRLLTSIEMYLNITSSQRLQFLVYESLDGQGAFEMIHSTLLTWSGVGRRFYGTGPIEVPLVEGRHYLIGAAWEGTVSYFSEEVGQVTTSFGIGYGRQQLTPLNFPLTGDLADPQLNNRLYYFRLTSKPLTTFGASGSMVTGELRPATIERWGTLTYHGDVPAGTTLRIDVLPAVGGAPLPGYANLPSGADLGALGDTPIRLRARFTATDPSMTATLFDWELTWQRVPEVSVESHWSAAVHSSQVTAAADFTGDGVITGSDVDALHEVIRLGSWTPTMDLNDDGRVDRSDVAHLLVTLLHTQYGDVNFDRRVDATDLRILATNFGRHGGWAIGNVDGIGGIDIDDLSRLVLNIGFNGLLQGNMVDDLLHVSLPAVVGSGGPGGGSNSGGAPLPTFIPTDQARLFILPDARPPFVPAAGVSHFPLPSRSHAAHWNHVADVIEQSPAVRL